MPIKILMPALSPTMNEGNLVKWHKKEGDDIKAGQVLAEIETDKATMEIEAVDEGTLARIIVPEGTEQVKVNAIIGYILEEGEEVATLEQELKSSSEASVSQPPLSLDKGVSDQDATYAVNCHMNVASSKDSHKSENNLSHSSSRIFVTPLARRMAEQQKLDLQNVSGTGPRGRIVKADIEQASFSQKSISSTGSSSFVKTQDFSLEAPYQSLKLTSVRRVIAQRLTESKQTVPHFYLTIDCEIDELLKVRQQINQHLQDDQKVSVNDFVIKAIAMALRRVPEANAAWGEDHIKIFDRADVSVAVASDTGLITPIVRGADQKSLGQIALETKELITKARNGKLKPHEFQGGTFSLSNLGMYGIKHFGAIVNPPQGCILAVGTGEARPVVKDHKIEIATVMTCTLSVDHRVVDGAVGAEFLKHFKHFITCPVTFIL